MVLKETRDLESGDELVLLSFHLLPRFTSETDLNPFRKVYKIRKELFYYNI